MAKKEASEAKSRTSTAVDSTGTKKAAPKKIATKKDSKKAEIVAESAPVEEKPEAKIEVKPEPKATAKAGKRSVKAVKETQAKQAKEVRKQAAEKAEKPKEAKKPPRTRLDRAGKKYRQLAVQIEKDKAYSLAEALDLATKTSPTKFDATVEMHINLAVDPKQADQNVRDIVVLPAGTGKTIRVAVADDALLAKLDKEEIDFDVLVATPDFMPKLGKYAKLLGPRGLMPNPKSGTVTTDVAGAIKSAKSGRVEYRVDQAGIVHLGIGKVSFGAQKLTENAEAIMASIRAARPASIKGTYIKGIAVTTTMGPAIKVDTTAK